MPRKKIRDILPDSGDEKTIKKLTYAYKLVSERNMQLRAQNDKLEEEIAALRHQITLLKTNKKQP